MQHLTPVGLSKDGTSLVLASNSGEEFVVPVDHRLRAALRSDHARLGQLEMKMESALRPRDIQARIRAGESAEDVAAAAQTSVEAIMPYAVPVLAERAHIAETARKSSIRRASADASPVARTLADAAPIHLTAVSVRTDDVTWDAWRRDDGRWALVATYAVRGTAHRAEFSYDQPGRYVTAENHEALLLTGEADPVAAVPAPAGRRLSAVPGPSSLRSLGDDELPLGDDAIELVRDHDRSDRDPAHQAPFAAAEPEPAEPSIARHQRPGNEPTTELHARVPIPEEFDDLAADHADADWITDLHPDAAPATDTGSDQPREADAEASVEDQVPDEAAAAVGQDGAQHRRKGRSSVPSWDEIMFGGGKGD